MRSCLGLGSLAKKRHDVWDNKLSCNLPCIIITRNGIEHWCLQMCVGIDASRHDKLPFGVYNFPPFLRLHIVKSIYNVSMHASYVHTHLLVGGCLQSIRQRA